MEIKKFEHPTIEDIQKRFDEEGISALTNEDIATLLGTCEAYRDKLSLINQIAKTFMAENGLYISPIARLQQISGIVDGFADKD